MAKDEKKPAEEVLNAAEVIEKTGSVTAGRIQCLTIIGQIEGHYLADNTAKTTKY